MFEEDIKRTLKEQVEGEITLEVPPNPAMGDFAFPCFQLAKVQKKAPPQIAQELAGALEKPESIERIEAKGPYVNFYVDKTKRAKQVIANIFSQKDKYGSSAKEEGEVVAIDYSHPNIGKPFHFGHLRSTIIGESIARLLEFQGAKVLRLNYLGDWGTQFGKLIYAYLEWGDEKQLEKNPIKHLLELYVDFNAKAKENPGLDEYGREWFARLEQGDAQATELWGLFRSHSLEEFKRVYKVLGSEFNSWNGEAFIARQVPEAMETIKKKGITELDEGALIVRLEKYDAPFILIKSDGSTTYGSRDVAAIMHRLHDLNATKVLYVVGHEQSLHFNQLFDVIDKCGHPREIFKHVAFGMYLSPEGGKLSTRAGKVVLMDDVLNEAIGLAKQTIEEKNPNLANKEEVARIVGVGAILFGDLQNDRQKDVKFDLKRFTSFEGDTGPYLQYTHARAASVIRKARELGAVPSKDANVSLLVHSAEQAIITTLEMFPAKVREAANECKPHIIAQCLLDVAHAFNEFYHDCPCLQEKEELRSARITLVEASRQVMEIGLGLLGIVAPHEM